ncbi:MAG TPA: hypothetical protein VLK33_03515 [Terriglobales bacterium]|nr:hypothetical protein [Terriglobales bacterium]
MPEELFDEQNEEKVDWAKYWAIARRRCWMFVLPFFVGWAVVWSISWLLPSVYRSSALIIVRRQSTQLVTSKNTSDELQNGMDSISQQVYSRTNLLNIAKNVGLYEEQRASGKFTDDEVVERMRKNIDIEIIQSSDRVLSSFKLYFSSPNPELARQVNSELVNLLISGTLESRLSDIQQQIKVLDNGLEDARTKLSAQEEKVRQYKDRHSGELPDYLQSNLQILSGKQGQLQNEQDALNQAKQRRAYLESLKTQYESLSNTTKPGETPVGLPALDQELTRLKAQLADLSARYTDQHPDVRKVKEQIASTQRTKDQFLAQLKNKPQDSNDTAGDSPSNGPLIEVNSQLKSNSLEIANREREVQSLQSEINGYQSRLSTTPVRQQELTDLNRDYDQLKAFYDQLLTQKNQATLTDKIIRQQQGDTLTMQDAPSRPTKPESPNRFKLSLLGIFAGLAVGLAVAGGAEFLDDRVYDEAVFKQMVPAEILVEIPALHTPEEEQQQKRWQKFSFAGMGLIGIIVVLGTAISFLRG